jgi:ABC-type oligopeptide transport system substrate-binding subunit
MFCVLAAVGGLAAAGSGLEDSETPRIAAPKGSAPGAEGDTFAIAFARRPRSLDPAFATDRTSQILLLNLMDPLVRLGPTLEPVPALARRWTVSADGLVVRFRLRPEARWRSGAAVTADDVEFAWKRVLSPQVDSPLAEELFAIEGAAAYHRCTSRCSGLADAVGVRALNPRTLEVRLESPQSWFVASVARPAFLPVSRTAVTRHGDGWTAPGVIATDGPFVLAGMTETGVSLVKSPRWRAAATVGVGRVEGLFISDPVARVQAFDEGRVQALDGSPLPTNDLLALRERREYESYPSLAVRGFAFNAASLPDVHQRRAMALALDRNRLIEIGTQGGEGPATRFVPQGLAPVGRTAPDSEWLPPDGDADAARAELGEAIEVKREVTLLYVDAPGNREVALALRDAWRPLGIDTTVRSRPAADYMRFEGSLTADSVDVYQLDQELTVPDAGPELDVWTCDSERNKTNFCNGAFDRLIARAREELDVRARSDLYAEADLVLSGSTAQMPGLPLLWPTYSNLEALRLSRTFAIDPLGWIDLTQVRIN